MRTEPAEPRRGSGTSGQLDEALAEAVAHRGPAMVEVMADPDLV